MPKNYFDGIERIVINRSQIHPADYNPRLISEDAKRNLRKSIKQFGVVGGIVVNADTGYTIVGGHQKVLILDELNHYNAETQENDYTLNIELVHIDEKTEKELNIMLNNPNAQGDWDYDMLRQLVPDIDYKNAGLSDADLSMIGCDFVFQTDTEKEIANALSFMQSPLEEQRKQQAEQRKFEREMEKQELELTEDESTDEDIERQARINHMKEVKQQVKEGAMQKAQDMDAYVMLSFSTFEAKATFMQDFGYNPYDKFIKGEDFHTLLTDDQ